MIVLCGIPSEAPVEMVRSALDELGYAYVMLNQRRFAESALDLEIAGGGLRGCLTIDRRAIPCADITGIYARVMDWHVMPEIAEAPAESGAAERCGLWHDALAAWMEVAATRVMNRASAMASNQSKPYQAQLIRQAGLRVPETLVTNDPDEVQAFRAEHGRIIYKSISGMRSIVRLLDDHDLRRLGHIRWCPVQFQRFIAGTNVRVHVVSGRTFATRIETDRVDYRYAHRDGGSADLAPFDLPDDVAEKCVALTGGLGLELAGIDLLFGRDGVYCFEVNPSPAFSYFERETGQPIARAIALALAGDG